MSCVTEKRIPLDGARAAAFDEAFEKRHAYIDAERIGHLIDGDGCVPLPGCPECGDPAENYVWATYDEEPGGELFIDVDPCGHLFRTQPVPDCFR